MHNNYRSIQINLETIRDRLNLDDKNITNLRNTVERNILKPLVDHGLIDSYESDEKGLWGIKYTIKRREKVKHDDQDSQK